MSLASLFAIAPGGGSFPVRFLALPLVATFVVACLPACLNYRRTLLVSFFAATPRAVASFLFSALGARERRCRPDRKGRTNAVAMSAARTRAEVSPRLDR